MEKWNLDFMEGVLIDWTNIMVPYKHRYYFEVHNFHHSQNMPPTSSFRCPYCKKQGSRAKEGE